MATELGDDEVAARLRAHAEEHHEPRWEQSLGEHTWGYGLGEPYPRGQFNALSAAAEVGERQSWWRLFNIPVLTRFSEPTVTGVDFPRVALRQAQWDGEPSQLTLTLAPLQPGGTTTFRVANLPDPARWEASSLSGLPVEAAATGPDLVVTTAAQPHTLVVRQAS